MIWLAPQTLSAKIYLQIFFEFGGYGSPFTIIITNAFFTLFIYLLFLGGSCSVSLEP